MLLLPVLPAIGFVFWWNWPDGLEFYFEVFSTMGSYLLVFISRNGSSGEIQEETLLEEKKMGEVFAASPKEEILQKKRKAPLELDGPPTLRTAEDLIEVPSSPEEGARSTPTTGRPSADKGEPGSPRPSTRPPLSAKDMISVNLTTLYPSGSLSPGEETDLANEIYSFKESILEELRRLTGPVNGKILWKDDSSGNTIRNPQSGGEYSPKMLRMILDSLRQEGPNSPYYEKFLNDRIDTLKNDELMNLKLEDLPRDKLEELNQAKLLTNQAKPLTDVKWGRGR